MVPDRPDCRLGAVIDCQLVKDADNVAFNGVGAQFHLSCYFKIGGALGNKTQNFQPPTESTGAQLPGLESGSDPPHL